MAQMNQENLDSAGSGKFRDLGVEQEREGSWEVVTQNKVTG